MPTPHNGPVMPRGALIGAALLVFGSIGSAALARHLGGPAASQSVTDGMAVVARDIRFSDAPDGALLATDAVTGTSLGRIAPGTNGFLRATLHSLARVRQQAGIGPDPAFRLTAWNDGRLTLDDPATRQRLDLEAFGPDNAGAFAQFLPLGASR